MMLEHMNKAFYYFFLLLAANSHYLVILFVKNIIVNINIFSRKTFFIARTYAHTREHMRVCHAAHHVTVVRPLVNIGILHDNLVIM
jgi:hypothetical protein